MSGNLTDWTTPFYLQFLHGNFVTQLKDDEQIQFTASVKKAMEEIDDEAIARMLSEKGWREKLTAAWFSGLTKRTQFQDQIGALLIESSCVYSGQGYCFALAAYATEKSSALLKAYLDRWLLRLDCYYDQDWAMAALDWIDKQRGTKISKVYLQPGGLWEKFTADKAMTAGFTPWHFEATARQFKNLMEFSGEHFGMSRN